ncbi:putative Pantothenate kinase [Operophtera brumata]|uniref:Putative Pantothenate kinase n=1 Tax=Operophtera brumata TaxID=104452 RepID=A0A0L7L809_OPEBR|nr:putative Pantothenate kinase [Operophtera brumata]
MDIGGTLTKLVYFEPRESNRRDRDKEGEVLRAIRRYLTRNSAYGKTGRRDVHLQVLQTATRRARCRGRSDGTSRATPPTARWAGATCTCRYYRPRQGGRGAEGDPTLARSKGMADLVNTIYATGGGAYKFEEDFIKEVNMRLSKMDELDALIAGVLYVDGMNPQECYYWAPPDEKPLHNHSSDTPPYAEAALSLYERKPYDFSSPYPFLLVNVGSGVSLLVVNGPDNYYRVSGTSFEEAIALAASGDNTTVDKLVRDIYGGDYARFGLPGDLVASSFGQMCSAERRGAASRADLARATLVTITNNIGSIARLEPSLHEAALVLDVVLVARRPQSALPRARRVRNTLHTPPANFLRVNPLSMKLLSYAMSYWSRGALKALFLEHEG